MRTIITTTGTSLISNYRNSLGATGKSMPTLQEILGYLREVSPEQASAETNSLSRLLQEGDEIVFLHSETDDGRLCTEALSEFYKSKGYRCMVKEISNLRYGAQQFKNKGLRSLVAEMAQIVRERKRQKHEVLINATGGFKVESAYAVLIGILFQAPVYYVHERFEDIIALPPIPVSWDYSLMVDHEDFFEWIHADLRSTHEATSRLQSIPDSVRMLLTEEDGYLMLSPAGEALWEAYRSLLSLPGQTVYWSDRARRYYENLDPETQRSFDRLINRLSRPGLRPESNIERMRNSDCLVYPRGKKPERIIFYEQDDKIYICELARHSDQSYERLLNKNINSGNYSDFEQKI